MVACEGCACALQASVSLVGGGTPNYLAPEVAQGTAPASAASDVYALAVLMFLALLP